MNSRSILAAFLLSLAASCVQLRFESTNIEEPITDAQLHGLADGADLGLCLDRLGAPHLVWEYRGDGVAIGYVQLTDSSFGIGASYALESYANISFRGDWADSTLPGVVLWFDADLRLLQWRRGTMRELTRSLRLRPAADDAIAP